MSAESLSFEDCSFDMIVSCYLIWNLPHPQKAYQEFYRVLKPRAYGIPNGNAGKGFEVMEEIARRIPLSSVIRTGDYNPFNSSRKRFTAGVNTSYFFQIMVPG